MKTNKLDLSKEIAISKVPIYAGMQFTYTGTKGSKIHVVGYDTFEFTYKIHSNGDRQLIAEKRIKRIFN